MNLSLLADWLARTRLYGMPLTELGIAVAVALGSWLAMSIALRYGLARAGAAAQRTTNHVDDGVVDILGGTNRWLLALAALLIGVGVLDLSPRWNARVGQLWFVALAAQFALWANRAVSLGLRRYVARHATPGMTQVSASATLLSWALRTTLWAVVLLAILSNLGVNITAFIASLGVGGIAVALAVQNILGDLLASLAIAVDKPFEVGDFIVVGSVAGSVEHVGLKTTRIRSLSGEQVVMSNTDLLKQTVSNYRRLAERRIEFGFGVSYDTTPEQAEAIPGVVERIVRSNDKLRFDRAHLKRFGDSSIDFEVVYIVLDPDFNLYMDFQQAINLALMRELGRLGVEFAFPTRTLHIAGDAPRKRLPAPVQGMPATV